MSNIQINLESLKVGDALPSLDIPITARLIVSGAIASQDFEDVHHDKAAANGKGTPDIFMNILTTNGIVGRYLSDCTGPTWGIDRIALKLGAPNFPGDTMVLSAEIVEIDSNTSDNKIKVTIDFKGKNGLGNHVSGKAYLTQKGDV